MYSEVAIKTKAENSGNRLTRKQKAEIYDNALQQVKNGQVDTQTIEAALGGEEYSTYKNVLNNYEVLQQELNEIQAVDNKVKTQEQATREIEIKNELERIKTKANKLKNILQNKVTEEIDTDNIHLKTRESYLWDSYIGNLPNFTKNNLNNVKTSQKFNYDAFVEGLWNDGRSRENSESIEYVENSQVESVENFENRVILKKGIAKGKLSLTINPEKQNPHLFKYRDMSKNKSYFTADIEDLQHLLNSYYATGHITISKSGQIKEIIFVDRIIGFDVDENGIAVETNGFKVHYSKRRTHLVPYRRRLE